MATELFKEYLARHLDAVNTALMRACQRLPEPVRPIATHIFSAGGKRLRPILCLLAAGAAGHGGKRMPELAITMEMLHAATLLHDDVLDNSDTRRGSVSAHLAFGVTEAILAGDAMLACANEIVAEWGVPELCRIFSRATSETAAGEILELGVAGRPDMAQDCYEAIVRGKTAWLLRASCGLGAIAAGADARMAGLLEEYGEKLGMAFQLVDDALDFAPQEITGKPRGGDLREAKLTLPVMIFRQGLDQAARADFDRRFAAQSLTEEEIARLARLIHENGAAKQTRIHAQKYLDGALRALEGLAQSPERKVLEEICAFVRDREK